jgi:hypothetical protein
MPYVIDNENPPMKLYEKINRVIDVIVRRELTLEDVHGSCWGRREYSEVVLYE